MITVYYAQSTAEYERILKRETHGDNRLLRAERQDDRLIVMEFGTELDRQERAAQARPVK